MTTVSDIVGDESDQYLVCKFFTQDLNEAILDKLKRMDKVEFSTQVHEYVIKTYYINTYEKC